MRAFYSNDDIHALLINANTKPVLISKKNNSIESVKKLNLYCEFVLPEWSLQYVEEARKLRNDQTLNAAVFTSQPEQVSQQRLYLQRQKHTSKEQQHLAKV